MWLNRSTIAYIVTYVEIFLIRKAIKCNLQLLLTWFTSVNEIVLLANAAFLCLYSFASLPSLIHLL